jgi:hypothetical protein
MRWNDRNSLKRLAEAPVPPLHRQLLYALQAKLGCDITPAFPDIADSANMSTLVGGSAAAAALKWQLVQCSTCVRQHDCSGRAKYAAANRVSAQRVDARAPPRPTLALHFIGAPPARVGCCGAGVYVGHDRWLMALPHVVALQTHAALNLLQRHRRPRGAWNRVQQPPLPDNHTAPGCMLRFDVSGVGGDSSVAVGFAYADVTAQDPIPVYQGTAVFTDLQQASKVSIPPPPPPFSNNNVHDI